jgi:hypothetical protein
VEITKDTVAMLLIEEKPALVLLLSHGIFLIPNKV